MKFKEFFIEPIGGETNGRLFRDILTGRDEDVCERMECTDGSTPNLLRVSVDDLAMCIVNRRTSGLAFNVFVKTERGIEKIRIVFDEETTEALNGRTDFDKAKIDFKRIAKLLPSMPLESECKLPRIPVPSPYGAAPKNLMRDRFRWKEKRSVRRR